MGLVSRMLIVVCGLMVVLAGIGRTQAQDSLGMRRVSGLDYWGLANGIEMVGDLAYVVSGNILHILDLADPAQPVEIGQGSWWAFASGGRVQVVGNRAYVAGGYGLVVFDVSNPAHPMKLVEWIPWGAEVEFEDVFVHGNIAIVRINGRLYMADISNLENIDTTYCFPSSVQPNRPFGMAGEYLCMSGSLGLSVWDISDPTLPVQVAEADTLFFSGAAAISGNHVCLCTHMEDGMCIVDISNPLQPFIVSWCDSGTCEAVTVTGDHAVVSKGWGLNIWNIADPTQPVFESTFAPWRRFESLCSSGPLVCAGDIDIHSPALIMVDITDPYAPTEISTFGTIGFLRRIAVSGTVGYLAASGPVLHTVDLSDPTEVVELGIADGESCAGGFDLAIRGDYAYLACATSGLLVYDISDPAHPESLSADGLYPGEYWWIAIADDYAYVFDSYRGLRTFSLEDPAAPVCVDTLRINCGGCGMVAANGYLYCGAERTLRVFSLADPAAPQLVGSCNLPSGFTFRVEDIVVLGTYVYVAYNRGGVRVVDIGDPTHPTEVGSIWEPTWAVAAGGNTLITFGHDGFRVWDVTDRLNPVMAGYYITDTTDEWIQDLEILEPYLLTASGYRFRVYQCDALSGVQTRSPIMPEQLALYPCYPNPFNSSTTITFSIPRVGHTRLAVYDVTGRQVAVLVDGVVHAGDHHVMFDGSVLASGVYFVRLEAGMAVQTEKMVLIR